MQEVQHQLKSCTSSQDCQIIDEYYNKCKLSPWTHATIKKVDQSLISGCGKEYGYTVKNKINNQ